MRVVSLILLGLVLIAVIHEIQAGGKKKSKKDCEDEEVDKNDAKDLQMIEDCIKDMLNKDKEKADKKKIMKECFKKLTGECSGLSKFFKKAKKDIESLVDKAFGSGGKVDFESLLKDGLDKLVAAGSELFKGK